VEQEILLLDEPEGMGRRGESSQGGVTGGGLLRGASEKGNRKEAKNIKKIKIEGNGESLSRDGR